MMCLVALAVAGVPLESLLGWVTCPAWGIGEEGKGGQEQHRGWARAGVDWRAGWEWLRRSWVIAAVRSEALLVLVFLTERWEWEWVCLLPWVAWVWKGAGVVWPRLASQGLYRGWVWAWEEAGGIALLGLAGWWVSQQMQAAGGLQGWGLPVGMGMQWVEGRALSAVAGPYVAVEEEEDGIYHVCLSGTFELYVDGKVTFYKRMLVIFLGLLEVPGETRGSRRTRDGRTPFVRQQQMESWFGVPQSHISLCFKYWLRQDWEHLLSQRWGEVLTAEVRQRVIDSWALFPWWSAQRLYQHLRSQGRRVTLSQVKQIGRESGWTYLRQRLQTDYQISADAFRPRDGWLVKRLLGHAQRLVEQLEALDGLPHEERIGLADLEAVCEQLDLLPAPARRPLPWMLHIERVLLGHWEDVDDGTVRCIYCGTTDVSRKSRTPRWKRYVDEQGEEQKVAVYRYYCHNPACEYQTFTNLPPHLIPYSKYTLNHHLAALQTYEWGHSIYRHTSQMLAVSKMTAYRWVSAFGYQVLPVAALFGVVRSSGMVGIDEKYVLVPKNDKPAGKMRRWMYVYLAVDSYTYDLLHIEIYPFNTKQSAKTFLLALRAKGYYPRVVVTDMRMDYRDVVAQVFPHAVHHECIFHALQELREKAKEAYGIHYAETHPQVKRLLEEIDAIFDASTKRTAQRRYQKVLAQREHFEAHTPAASAIFDFLERHWDHLVNAIESRIVPTTNNAVEQVIRVFNQHYKTFCGFESIESARLYLGVFEKVYRFTPFSNDAQERIRGKCPLELAGYEIQRLPMAQLFRGLALQWPASAFQELVPNV
jgi:transposase-like protein